MKSLLSERYAFPFTILPPFTQKIKCFFTFFKNGKTFVGFAVLLYVLKTTVSVAGGYGFIVLFSRLPFFRRDKARVDRRAGGRS